MTLPRRVRRGTTYLVTRRCLLRMFLLRPSPVVEHVVSYCMAQAAARYGVAVHCYAVLSNHVHVLCTDPRGELPRFMEWLDGVVARALNVHYRRGESFWAPGSYSAVALGDGQAVMDKLVYTITNPVAAGLVSTPADWPGMIALPEDVGARTLEATRPDFFFQKRREEPTDDEARNSARARRRRQEPAREPLPERVSLAITKPPAFADVSDDDFRRQLRAAVDARVREIHERRAAAGLRGWLGADAVLMQHHLDTPGTSAPDGSLNPRVACKDRWRRIELLTTQREFWRDYELARTSYKAGDHKVLFPEGTYWFRVHLGARCRPAA